MAGKHCVQHSVWNQCVGHGKCDTGNEHSVLEPGLEHSVWERFREDKVSSETWLSYVRFQGAGCVFRKHMNYQISHANIDRINDF